MSATAPQTITSEVQKLEPSAIVELFELDATNVGAGISRFHAGTNGLRSNVVWQGNTYTAFPVTATGFDFSGNGQLPRPKLAVANITGAISLLVLQYDDLLGAKVTRRRTLAKYLDAVNYPARRNLLTYTEQFDNAAWTVTNASIAANAATAPDGALTADKLIETSANSIHRIFNGAAVTVGTTAATCYSIYAKAAERSAIRLTDNDLKGADFNLLTGAVTNIDAGIISATAISVGSGWYRCSISRTTSTGTGRAVVYLINSGVTSYTGDGSSGVYIWGSQIEDGAEATAYQPVGATWSQNPTADATAEFPSDIFYIDRKSAETKDAVEFELAAAFDLSGVQLPRRQIIQNVCLWAYRGTECGYSGTAYFDASDVPVGSAALDKCGKRLSSCKARFGTNSELPFGSFPSAGLVKT